MLNIYKENDQIIIEDNQEKIEIPYNEDIYDKLQGEITHDEYKGWLIDGVELDKIISQSHSKISTFNNTVIYKLHKENYGEPIHVIDKEKFVDQWLEDNRVSQQCETDEEYESVRQEMLNDFEEIDIEYATPEKLHKFFNNEYWFDDLENIENGLGEYVLNKIKEF